MKQKPTLFGQAFQISELRQQVAGLEEQNRKLVTEVKVLRESDRALFDAQEAMIDGLREVVQDYRDFAESMTEYPFVRNDSTLMKHLEEIDARATILLKKES